jgi:hypothetical protein
VALFGDAHVLPGEQQRRQRSKTGHAGNEQGEQLQSVGPANAAPTASATLSSSLGCPQVCDSPQPPGAGVALHRHIAPHSFPAPYDATQLNHPIALSEQSGDRNAKPAP